jgi:hypothetical protein
VKIPCVVAERIFPSFALLRRGIDPSLNPDESAKHPARFRSPRSGMEKPKRGDSVLLLFPRNCHFHPNSCSDAQALSAVAPRRPPGLVSLAEWNLAPTNGEMRGQAEKSSRSQPCPTDIRIIHHHQPASSSKLRASTVTHLPSSVSPRSRPCPSLPFRL